MSEDSPQSWDDQGLRGRVDAWLHGLRLPGPAARYRSLAEESGAGEDALRFLEGVLAAELESRELRHYQRNLRAAKFPQSPMGAGAARRLAKTVPKSVPKPAPSSVTGTHTVAERKRQNQVWVASRLL